MLYSAGAYALFVGVFAAFVGFLWNVPGLKGIDGAAEGPTWAALVVDVVLLAVFGAQHSVMARPRFKRAWTRVVPAAAERSTYVLVSSLLLALVLGLWRPVPTPLWDLRGGPAEALLLGLSGAGWIFLTVSTFSIDHFHLHGLQQGWRAARGLSPREPEFRVRGPYRHVRHPIMLGFLVAFWAAPLLSVGRLVFSAGMTLYILAALRYEERDLDAALGPRYRAYAARTPRLLPFGRR